MITLNDCPACELPADAFQHCGSPNCAMREYGPGDACKVAAPGAARGRHACNKEASDLAHPADAGAVAVEQAIQMILHCPKCGLQHIDAPEKASVRGGYGAEIVFSCEWTNPPHRSHLCHGCNHIWRPADVPTEGVRAIETRGKGDSPISRQPQASPLEATSEQPLMSYDEFFAEAKRLGCKLPAEVCEQMAKAEPFAYAGVWRGNSILTSLDRKSVEDWVNYSAGRSMVVLFDHPTTTADRAAEGEATSEQDEPTDREALIASLEDDAAKLSDANPDDEMAQTMREAAAMLEATSERKPLTPDEAEAIFQRHCASGINPRDRMEITRDIEQHHGIHGGVK